MPGPVFLEGAGVELRTIEEEDVDFLQRTINDPRVRTTLAPVRPMNRGQERAWVESLGETESVNLLVCDDETPVGSVDLKPPNQVWGVAEVGVMIAPEHWNEGYATAAIDLLCQYAFETRRLNKVYGTVYATNPAIRRVLEKVGFQEEGVLRKEGFVDGDHVDLHRYGLLADEWRAD